MLEREVQSIKAGKPDVIADRVFRLSTDINDVRSDVDKLANKVDGMRRVFMGLLVTIAGSAVAIIIAQVLLARPA